MSGFRRVFAEETALPADCVEFVPRVEGENDADDLFVCGMYLLGEDRVKTGRILLCRWVGA